jgi:uridine kinase
MAILEALFSVDRALAMPASAPAVICAEAITWSSCWSDDSHDRAVAGSPAKLDRESTARHSITMRRPELLGLVAGWIAGVVRPHPVRVGIDGVDGVGKTTFANELADVLSHGNRQVIRASIDGFHNPRAVRYARGRSSPDGYFRDSFDLGALVSCLLAPLGPGGSGRFRRAVFDYRVDQPVRQAEEAASPDAILLFDGVFLHLPALRPHWDLTLFLDAPFEVTVARMAGRDGGSPEIDAPANRRYVEGQRIYMQECDPKQSADVVIDNSALDAPTARSHAQMD